jgi:DNA ligase 1
MKAFADLYARLDSSTSSNAKLAALEDYFRASSHADAAWAVFFLSGGRPRQLVSSKVLRDLTLQASGLPQWLFDESYEAVGDLAETISLLLPLSEHRSSQGLAACVEDSLIPLRGLAPQPAIARLLPLLTQMERGSQLVCIKLITGSFRVGVARLLVTRALSALVNIDPKVIAQRLIGYCDLSARPTAEQFQHLIATSPVAGAEEREGGHPYPFFLAHSLQIDAAEFSAQVGPPEHWLIEWKWDGIRAQLVKRNGQLWLWSRGEDLLTDRFPELASLGAHIPDGTVMDGEIVVWVDDRVQPFALLQQRIGRKNVTRKILATVPVAMLAFDLLECEGADMRQCPQLQRRALLERVIAQCAREALRVSPLLRGADWRDFARQRSLARSLGVEGLMLKNKNAQYGVGRSKDVGVWWKWKIDPYSVDAVLVYAQGGHGRRAGLYTDFTFALWDAAFGVAGRSLVPFAKAYSGLTDAEMRQVDAIIRRTTVEKFGPVRSVTPSLVFELGFEGLSLSTRHRSGVAVRFPRMLRWRHDKPIEQADTLQTLRALLPGEVQRVAATSGASRS